MKTNIYHFKSIVLGLCLVAITSLNVNAKETSNAWPFTLHCPPNVYISCTDNITNLSIYGNATYTYGSHTYSAGTPTVQYNLNSCNAGTITRTWMVEDHNWVWHSCTQTIFVSTGGSGGPVIDWPEDVELTGCNPNTNPYQMPGGDANYPTWESGTCSMLGRSYSDMLFTVNSQCKKIMRTWKVLDWCNYSPSQGYGIYTRVQIIYIINNTAPVVNCPAEITVNTFNCKDAEVTVSPLTVDPSVCGGSFEITNNSPFAKSKGSNITGIYPVGTTKVTYTVKYGCGKTKTCITNVVVKNASRPTPYCIGQIVTTLMPVDTDKDGKVDNGMVEIWAKDLNKGSFSKCGYHPLKFSFSKDVKETSKTFTCDDLGSNKVQMWVTDSRGGQEFCEVEVIIQNNGANIPNCKRKVVTPVDPLYRVKGNVLTLTDTPVKNATMTFRYTDPIVKYTITYDTTETLELDSFYNFSGYKLYRYITVKKITEKKDSTIQFLSKSTKTNTDGFYLIDSLPLRNKKLEITGSYSDAPKNNLDHKDVELLTKFLLGEITFSNYFQYLAADINEDGKIDITDQNLLMELVTDKITALPGTNQWYLLDKKATFAKPEDVLKGPIPTVVKLDSISATQAPIDFIAIKKGNISVDPGSLQPSVLESRSSYDDGIISVFPNPFTNDVTFKVEHSKDVQASLSIYALNGQMVSSHSYPLSKGVHEINVLLDQLQDGLYFYQWNLGDQTVSGKINKIK